MLMFLAPSPPSNVVSKYPKEERTMPKLKTHSGAKKAL